MPSHTDTAGHTKAFIYPVMDQWGSHSALAEADLNTLRPVGPKSNGAVIPSWRIKYTSGPQQDRDLLPIGGIACANSPAAWSPAPGGRQRDGLTPWNRGLSAGGGGPKLCPVDPHGWSIGLYTSPTRRSVVAWETWITFSIDQNTPSTSGILCKLQILSFSKFKFCP